MSKTNKIQPVKLLWTGGYDSTFRLCELLFIYGRTVQPYYLIDPERKSIRNEILAQERLKKVILQKNALLRDRILPTLFYLIPEKNIDSDTHYHYEKIIEKVPFGSQYEWLANFCLEHNIENIELSVEKSTGHVRYEYFKNFLTEIDIGEIKTFTCDPAKTDEHVYELFKFFQMPLFDKTKHEMVRLAKQNNFTEILKHIWFCHTPINDKPCGRCNPCKDVMYYGFKHRLPLAARMRYHTRLFSRPGLAKIYRLIKN